MNYWLMKTEPSTYSWDDLVKEKKTEWTGVRNFEARNNMRAMKKGDQVFVYHSVKEKEIVGIAEVVCEAQDDSTDKTDTWCAVTIAPIETLQRRIPLKEIQSIPACNNMSLIRRTRLSVTPVTKEEWKAILAASKKHS